MSDLTEAIEILGAVEVAPGRYAFRHTAYGKWALADADDMRRYQKAYEREHHPQRPDANATWRWHFSKGFATLPSWWTPSQQFAWRLMAYDLDGRPNSKPHYFATEQAAQQSTCHYLNNHLLERITADLETGAEVEA